MPHRKILIGVYLALAAFLLAEIVVFWSDAVHSLREYLDTGFAGYAAVAVAYTTPISCLILAYLVHRRSRNPVIALFAAHTTFILPFAALPAVYLLWWYFRKETDNEKQTV